VRLALGLTLLAALLAPAAAFAGRTVPLGWSGMVVGALGTTQQSQLEWNRMVSSGVESTRAAFYWSSAQPYASYADVPPDRADEFTPDANGVPTDFRRTDEVVAATAARGLSLLPVVVDAPRWAARQPGRAISQPRDPETYAGYVTDLVERYGSHGTFWSAHPELPARPVTQWQVWNEPNLRHYWPSRAWVGEYLALLRAARRAIRSADPQAKVVLAGLTGAPWHSLESIYRAHGRALFDTAAIHPYTAEPRNVVRIAQFVRTVMRRYGDARKPLLLSELSWPSALDPRGHSKTRARYTYSVTEREQAQRVASIYPRLARVRRSLRITGVYWYTWISRDRSRTLPFDYAGLRADRGEQESRAKPAFKAWTAVVLGLEGCRQPKLSVSACG
jgi:hypothetical protein